MVVSCNRTNSWIIVRIYQWYYYYKASFEFNGCYIGMQGVYGGINLVITKGKAVTGIPADTQALGKQSIGPIPIPFIICLVVLILILFMVKKTKTGRYIYAIGNSKEAAKILGIKVDRIRVMIYSIVGFISALAGLLYVCRLGSAQTAIGEDWPIELYSCILLFGGVALTGGWLVNPGRSSD